ncbi:hypothetical protein ACOMHN_030414 [Nucella lapillus]
MAILSVHRRSKISIGHPPVLAEVDLDLQRALGYHRDPSVADHGVLPQPSTQERPLPPLPLRKHDPLPREFRRRRLHHEVADLCGSVGVPAVLGWISVDSSASSRHKSSTRALGTVHPAQQAQPESAGLGASTAGPLCFPDAAPGPQRASLDDAATTRVPSPPSQVGTLHEGVTPRGSTQSTVAAVSCHPPYSDGTTGACGATSGRVATTTGTSFCVSAESSCGPTRSPEAVSTGPTRPPGVVSTGPTRLLGAGSMGPTCSSAKSTCPGQSSEAESTGSTQWSEAVSVGPTRATGPTRLLGAGSIGSTCSSAESTCLASRLKLSLQGPPSGLKLFLVVPPGHLRLSLQGPISLLATLWHRVPYQPTQLSKCQPHRSAMITSRLPRLQIPHTGGLLGPLTLPVASPYLLSTRLGDPRSVLKTRPGGGRHSQPTSLHGSLCRTQHP